MTPDDRNWLDQLQQDLRADQTPGPRTFALATTGQDGRPDVRTLVLRSLGPSGGVQFVTDARTEKHKELAHCGFAAACFWLIEQRVQWRLRGPVRAEQGGTRQATWSGLSDAARALFAWPACGAAFDENATFPREVPQDSPLPSNFEVLTLQPSLAERLDLGPHPHERLRWDGMHCSPIRLNP